MIQISDRPTLLRVAGLVVVAVVGFAFASLHEEPEHIGPPPDPRDLAAVSQGGEYRTDWDDDQPHRVAARFHRVLKVGVWGDEEIDADLAARWLRRWVRDNERVLYPEARTRLVGAAAALERGELRRAHDLLAEAERLYGPTDRSEDDRVEAVP